MTFIRKKEITPRSGRLYDYEVENHREGGKVKQKVIRYIGIVRFWLLTFVLLIA
jgi:hypothetical protein